MVAIVNTVTGKIINCKRGSKEWWHEKGHIEFANDKKGIELHYWQNNFFHYSYILLMLSVFWIIELMYLSISFYLLYIAMDIYEERWCWAYAKNKMKAKYKKEKDVKK